MWTICSFPPVAQVDSRSFTSSSVSCKYFTVTFTANWTLAHVESARSARINYKNNQKKNTFCVGGIESYRFRFFALMGQNAKQETSFIPHLLKKSFHWNSFLASGKRSLLIWRNLESITHFLCFRLSSRIFLASWSWNFHCITITCNDIH